MDRLERCVADWPDRERILKTYQDFMEGRKKLSELTQQERGEVEAILCRIRSNLRHANAPAREPTCQAATDWTRAWADE